MITFVILSLFLIIPIKGTFKSGNPGFIIYARNTNRPDLPVLAIELASNASIHDLSQRIIDHGSTITGLISSTIPQQLQLAFANQLITDHQSLLSDLGISSEMIIDYSLRRDYQPLIVSLETNKWNVSNINLGYIQLPCHDVMFHIHHLVQDWLEENCPEITYNGIIIGFKHKNYIENDHNKSEILNINIYENDNRDIRKLQLPEIHDNRHRFFSITNISRIQQADIRDALMTQSQHIDWIFTEDIIRYNLFNDNYAISLRFPTRSERYSYALMNSEVTLQHLLYYSNQEIRVWSQMPLSALRARKVSVCNGKYQIRFRHKRRPRFVKSRDLEDGEMVIWIESLPSYTTMIFCSCPGTDVDT